VLGGTFDRFHLGHRALLASAFRVGGSVAIGLTTDEYLARHPKAFGARIATFASRRRALESYLRRTYPARTWRIAPLHDAFGGALAADVDVLVASAGTRSGAARVNRVRRARHLRPLRLRLIPTVLANDLLPLTSTRIRSGVIDREGRRLRPLRLGIVGSLPTTIRGELAAALRLALPTRPPIRWLSTAPQFPARAATQLAGQRRGRAPPVLDYTVEVLGDRSPGRRRRVRLADTAGPLGAFDVTPDSRRLVVAAQLARILRQRRGAWERSRSPSR
jgi:pantetheine-phosphate adenylyltransferase